MTATLSALKADYLDRVAAGLGDLPDEDREEVLHDLRAHLAELDESEVQATLGSPDDFVAEFRASAGLGQSTKRLGWSLTRTRSRLEKSSQRLAEVVRWNTWRPLWIWTRGWLLVSTLAVLTGGTAFRRFPIPSIEESTPAGLVLVAAATWISVWLNRRRTVLREFGSFLYNAVAVVVIAASLVSGVSVSRDFHFDETEFLQDRMVGPEGQVINNIYAYDLDGEPVEVLLFDQEGRPLMNFPPWVYEEAELSPEQGPVPFEEGMVEFTRDEFGRIIPNLYPLSLWRYGELGTRLEPVPPPALGFPGSNEMEGSGDSTVVTTTTPGPLD